MLKFITLKKKKMQFIYVFYALIFINSISTENNTQTYTFESEIKSLKLLSNYNYDNRNFNYYFKYEGYKPFDMYNNVAIGLANGNIQILNPLNGTVIKTLNANKFIIDSGFNKALYSDERLAYWRSRGDIDGTNNANYGYLTYFINDCENNTMNQFDYALLVPLFFIYAIQKIIAKTTQMLPTVK
jgi:hypothetical protein